METQFIPSSHFQVCEVDLVYKPTFNAMESPKVGCPQDAYLIFRNAWNPDKISLVEHCKALYLNRAGRVLAMFEISTGSASGILVDPKMVFLPAIRLSAAYIIMAHNHPSGQLIPSDADKHITRKLAEAGRMLDIPLNDHLILTAESFYSFADEGLL